MKREPFLPPSKERDRLNALVHTFPNKHLFPLERPALATSLAKHLIVCHPLKKSSSERRRHLPFSLLIVFFLEHPLFPLPDGGSFSADPSTIQLRLRRVQQEERSACEARGARDGLEEGISYPTHTGNWSNFQTILGFTTAHQENIEMTYTI